MAFANNSIYERQFGSKEKKAAQNTFGVIRPAFPAKPRSSLPQEPGDSKEFRIVSYVLSSVEGSDLLLYPFFRFMQTFSP